MNSVVPVSDAGLVLVFTLGDTAVVTSFSVGVYFLLVRKSLSLGGCILGKIRDAFFFQGTVQFRLLYLVLALFGLVVFEVSGVDGCST